MRGVDHLHAFYEVISPFMDITVRKTHRLVLIIFNQTAALFMTNKVRGTSQLNIDILMSGSHRDFDL